MSSSLLSSMTSVKNSSVRSRPQRLGDEALTIVEGVDVVARIFLDVIEIYWHCSGSHRVGVVMRWGVEGGGSVMRRSCRWRSRARLSYRSKQIHARRCEGAIQMRGKTNICVKVRYKVRWMKTD